MKFSRRLAMSACLGGLLIPKHLLAAAPTEASWERYERVIDNYFQGVIGWHPQAFITQGAVKQLWPALAKAGWNVPDVDIIERLIPRDNEFLARQFRTPAGKRFMKFQATKYPGIYDRLDRMSSVPSGEVNTAGLIAAEDVEDTVRYMMSKDGTRSWGSLLAEPKKFGKPTGRLYTAELLDAKLKDIYLQKIITP